MSEPIKVHKVEKLPNGDIHIEHEPYMERGVHWGSHTILSTFPRQPRWRRLLARLGIY